MQWFHSHADDPDYIVQVLDTNERKKVITWLPWLERGISLDWCSPGEGSGSPENQKSMHNRTTLNQHSAEAYQGQQRAVGRGCARSGYSREEVSEEETWSRG